MLRSLEALRGYTLLATDGEIGRAKDFLFDDRSWTVRYLLADTGSWLSNRLVLVSPVFVGEPMSHIKRLPVDLSRRTIENSPPLERHAPVSLQNERRLLDYYRIAPYWRGPELWGANPRPLPAPASNTGEGTFPALESEPFEIAEEDGASRHHLRSADEVTGYAVAASDRKVGEIEDFIAESETWAIRWLVVATGNWLKRHKVVVSPGSVEGVSWRNREFRLSLTAEQIENSPELVRSEPVAAFDRDYEKRLHDYYDSQRA